MSEPRSEPKPPLSADDLLPFTVDDQGTVCWDVPAPWPTLADQSGRDEPRP